MKATGLKALMERNIPIYIYIDIYIYIYTPGMERSRPLLFAFCILCFWCGLSAISNLNTYCFSPRNFYLPEKESYMLPLPLFWQATVLVTIGVPQKWMIHTPTSWPMRKYSIFWVPQIPENHGTWRIISNSQLLGGSFHEPQVVKYAYN